MKVVTLKFHLSISKLNLQFFYAKSKDTPQKCSCRHDRHVRCGIFAADLLHAHL